MGRRRWVVGPVLARSAASCRPLHVLPVGMAVAWNRHPGASKVTSTSGGPPMSGGTSGGRPSPHPEVFPDDQHDDQMFNSVSVPPARRMMAGGREKPAPGGMATIGDVGGGDVDGGDSWATGVTGSPAWPHAPAKR